MARKSRSRSGLHPSTFQSLPESEKTAVRAAMQAYNQQYLDRPYFEIEEFYQNVYRVGGWFA